MSMFRGPWWIVRETVASLLFGAKVALKRKFVAPLKRWTAATTRKTKCALGLHELSDSGYQLYEFNPPTYRCKHCGELFE